MFFAAPFSDCLGLRISESRVQRELNASSRGYYGIALREVIEGYPVCIYICRV